MQVSAVGRRYQGRRLLPITTAPQGPRDTGGGPELPQSGQLDRNTLDLHSAERDNGDLRPDVQQSPETAPKRASSGGQDGGDAHGLVQPGRSRGGCWRSCYTKVRIDLHQSRRGVNSTEHLTASHLWSRSRRVQPKYLVLSKPPWRLFPSSMPNIRFVLVPCSSYFSEDGIIRIPSPSRTRSKYFAHVLLRWRGFSNNLQVMGRKQNAVKDYRCMQAVFFQTRRSNPSSKLKDIEEQVRSLHGKSVLLRFTDSVQDSEDVNGLLEDLREAVNDYMVRS